VRDFHIHVLLAETSSCSLQPTVTDTGAGLKFQEHMHMCVCTHTLSSFSASLSHTPQSFNLQSADNFLTS
jgi:hypothetical protein